MSQPAPQTAPQPVPTPRVAAATASQGLAAGLRPAPAPARERREMTTSSVLAWWRVGVVLAALAVAVLAPFVLNNNKTSLLRVNAAAQQVLLLQSVRGHVLAAEASATEALLLAAPGQPPDGAYLDRLAAAAQKLTQAATLTPPDPGAMASISQALIGYTAELSAGMATGTTAQMGSASQYLQGTLLPALDDQIAKNLVLLEVSTADQRWLSALVAVPILAMVAAGVVVARRTRRLVNLGLLVGVAIAVVIWVNVFELVTTSAQSVSAVRSSGVTQATSVAGAYSAVTEAQAVQGRVLLGITPSAEGAQAHDEATAKAGEMLAKLPNAEADGMPELLRQLQSTHEQLMAAPAERRPALLQATDQPYQALIAWLTGQAGEIGSALDQQLSEHARTVERSVGIVAAGMGVVALAAGAGVSQPLRRYR